MMKVAAVTKVMKVAVAIGAVVMGVVQVAAIALFAGGCGSPALKRTDGHEPFCSFELDIPQRRDVLLDVLLVVETTPGMGQTQARLAQAAARAMDALVLGVPGPVDVHFGVTSADLGASPHASVPGCGRPGGDQGRLLVPDHCPGPVGASYLVDVSPRACAIIRSEDATCLSHSCTQGHCDLVDPAPTWLVEDLAGCPRCRNYDATSLGEAAACLVALGEEGCQFAQPLEAGLVALEDEVYHPDFLRRTAVLLLGFASRQDDCSAAAPEVLFDPADDSLEGVLGPLTPFRCFEHGVTCDVDDRLATGLRQGCEPRQEPDGLLTPVHTLAERLWAVLAERRSHVGVITGLVADASVRVARDAWDRPALVPSCETEEASPLPAIRTESFLAAFHDPWDLGVRLTSACDPRSPEGLLGPLEFLDLSDELRISTCLPAPLAGCRDPVAGSDAGGGEPLSPDTCQPTCQVTEVAQRGLVEETRTQVPPCLEVCPSGPCPDNTDPALAYRQGLHPSNRDPGLPAEVCWVPRHAPPERCSEANQVEIHLVRREGPLERTFAKIACRCDLSSVSPGVTGTL